MTTVTVSLSPEKTLVFKVKNKEEVSKFKK